MTGSGVCWIMVQSESSMRLSKPERSGASWLFLALRDVSDESLLAKYLLLLLLLPVNSRMCGSVQTSTTTTTTKTHSME